MYKEAAVSDRRPVHKTGAKRIRERQRRMHLFTGVLLVTYVYLPASSGSLFELAVKWVVLPLLVVDGVLMWQWPKVRRFARQLAARR
jgi:hypothetical protein